MGDTIAILALWLLRLLGVALSQWHCSSSLLLLLLLLTSSLACNTRSHLSCTTLVESSPSATEHAWWLLATSMVLRSLELLPLTVAWPLSLPLRVA